MLRLTEYGVPWDVAWGMSPVRRLACLIAGGEMRGGTYLWDRDEWQQKAPQP